MILMPMADAIVYATAKQYQAQIITLDADFQDFPGAQVLLP